MLADGEGFGVEGFDGLINFPPATMVIVRGGGVFFAAFVSTTERGVPGSLVVPVSGTGITMVEGLVAPGFTQALDFFGLEEETGKPAGVLQVDATIIEGRVKVVNDGRMPFYQSWILFL